MLYLVPLSKFSNLASIEIIWLFFCFVCVIFLYYFDNYFGFFDLNLMVMQSTDPGIRNIECQVGNQHSCVRVSLKHPTVQ